MPPSTKIGYSSREYENTDLAAFDCVTKGLQLSAGQLTETSMSTPVRVETDVSRDQIDTCVCCSATVRTNAKLPLRVSGFPPEGICPEGEESYNPGGMGDTGQAFVPVGNMHMINSGVRPSKLLWNRLRGRLLANRSSAGRDNRRHDRSPGEEFLPISVVVGFRSTKTVSAGHCRYPLLRF